MMSIFQHIQFSACICWQTKKERISRTFEFRKEKRELANRSAKVNNFIEESNYIDTSSITQSFSESYASEITDFTNWEFQT